jgi:hypothetical protein
MTTSDLGKSDFDAVDYFRAGPLYQDPYPYYEYLRSHGPVWREPHPGKWEWLLKILFRGLKMLFIICGQSANFL